MRLCLEDRFLLCAIQAGLETGGVEELGALSERHDESVDWDYVLATSFQHAIAPLVSHGLTTISHAALTRFVPPSVADELAESLSVARDRNRYLLSAVREVALAFNESGIDLIGLKDLGLVTQWSPDLGLRPIGDLDLLIRREQMGRAKHCLTDLGFLPRGSQETPYTQKYGFGCDLCRSRDNVWIDLQWNVMQREWSIEGAGHSRFPIERMWQNSVSHPDPELPLRIPGNEDMLYHLCLHVDGHAYAELILLCEIAKFLQHRLSLIDWPSFIKLVRETNSESATFFSLWAANRLFNAPLPDDILSHITPVFFEASLSQPIFGHLGPLHESLDAIHQSGQIPSHVLEGLEKQVRRQVVAASHVHDEIQGVLGGISASKGVSLSVRGTQSTHIFPNAPVDAFQTLDILIAEKQKEISLSTILKQRGYHESKTADGAFHWIRRTRILGENGVLNDETLVVETQFGTRGQDEPPHRPSEPSKRQLAWRSVMNGRTKTVEEDRISSAVLVLNDSPERIAVELAAELGGQEDNALLGICNLAHCLEQMKDRIHAELFWRHAETRNVTTECCAGLKKVSLLTDACIDLLLSNPPADVPSRRCFGRGRYNVDDATRSPHLKRPFFFVYSLVSLDSLVARARFLAQSLRFRSPKTTLWALIGDIVNGMASPFGSRRRNDPNRVFWMEVPGSPRNTASRTDRDTVTAGDSDQ